MAYRSPDMEEMNFQQNQQAPEMPPAPPSAKKAGLRSVILVLLLMLSSLVIIHETLLQITYITVVGNVHVSREEILRLSGLDGRVSYLNIREKDIQAGIDSHLRLEYAGLEKGFPNKLTLYVRERVPAVNLTVMDDQYIADATGYVLEKCESKNADNGLIHVTGLSIKRLQIGEVFTPVSEKQLSALQQVVGEMMVQNCISQFSELNVGDVENLYLVTVDAFSVNIGNVQDVRGKLLTVRGVLDNLRENGYDPGSLEATVPGYAIYTPPNM